jgi:predicted lipid carrier protein YhbT
MVLYLSRPWHDLALELAQSFPEHPGVSARMAYVVSGGPDGDITYHQITENGRVVQQGLGECENPDFTFSVTWADSVSVQKGELDPNVAFMQGRMKVAGNMGKVMALLPLTLSPEYKAMQEELRKSTEFA